MSVEWITPGLVIAVGLGLWRFLRTEIRDLRADMDRRFDALAVRLDRHLEGHP